MAKITKAEVNKITQALSIKGELIESTQTILRNIQVGDDLSGRIIYINIPEGYVPRGGPVAKRSDGRGIVERRTINIGHFVESQIGWQTLYNIKDGVVLVNETQLTLDASWGVVTEIYPSTESYQYIKIKATEEIVNPQLTISENFLAPEFIESTTFQIKSDGTVEASEFIEGGI